MKPIGSENKQVSYTDFAECGVEPRVEPDSTCGANSSSAPPLLERHNLVRSLCAGLWCVPYCVVSNEIRVVRAGIHTRHVPAIINHVNSEVESVITHARAHKTSNARSQARNARCDSS